MIHIITASAAYLPLEVKSIPGGLRTREMEGSGYIAIPLLDPAAMGTLYCYDPSSDHNAVAPILRKYC